MSLRFERQTTETLAFQFKEFSKKECRLSKSPFYETLCKNISEDSDLLELAKNVRKGQRAPNLFLAAVQYLVLVQQGNPLEAVYTDASKGIKSYDDFFPRFRSFCIANRREIGEILSTRTVQTNEVRRCATFLPALFLVQKRLNFQEFHFIDVGCSAGLNLLWDKYFYVYLNGISCGDESSELRIHCDVRGDIPPPLGDDVPKTRSRIGIEIEPIDLSNPGDIAWLQALIWPDQQERKDLFIRALTILKKNPPRIIKGDCREKIPEIVEKIPSPEPICLLFSHSVNQVFEEGRVGLPSLLEGLSHSNDIFEVSLGHFEERSPELILSEYRGGRKKGEERLGTSHPHGSWIKWNKR